MCRYLENPAEPGTEFVGTVEDIPPQIHKLRYLSNHLEKPDEVPPQLHTLSEVLSYQLH